jgi:PAS domain S-box-containing protein
MHPTPETFYHSLFQHSPLAKWICDQHTLRFLEVNDKAMEWYGYSNAEFLEMSLEDLYPQKGKQKLAIRLRNDFSDYKPGRQYIHSRKNGDLITVELVLHTVVRSGAPAYLMIVNDITEKMVLQHALIEQKLNRQKEILKATISGQEKQREEIAKELHDNVNQMLATAKLYLNCALDNKTPNRELIQKSMDTIVNCIDELRILSSSLVLPSLGEISLEDAIRALIAKIELVKATIVHTEIVGLESVPLSEGLKVSIYRIIQEQLNNIMKYAEASNIYLKIFQDDNHLSLIISDDGKGFDLDKKRKGIGLNNIISRAELYNGKATIDTAPGVGCSVIVRFSLHSV